MTTAPVGAALGGTTRDGTALASDREVSNEPGRTRQRGVKQASEAPEIAAADPLTSTANGLAQVSRVDDEPAMGKATNAAPSPLVDATWTELKVPGFEPALLFYRTNAPVFVVTHGAGGDARWHCHHFHRFMRGQATLLCPRGKLRYARDPSLGYYYPDHFALKREVLAALEQYEALVRSEGAAQKHAARDSTARDGTARDSTARDGTARDGAADDNAVHRGTARDGAADDNAVHRGTVRDSTARDGAADDNAVHRGTARDSTARDSTARDSTGAPYTYAGYSQGATMGALAFGGEGRLFSRLLLVEGGFADWSKGLIAAFKRSGGQVALFVCGTEQCQSHARGAVQGFLHAGLSAKLVVARGAGHRPDGAIGTATSNHLNFLLQGDPRWEGFVAGEE